jgi:succinate-semialdehyde dehydrogenase/glutarate-semialdehyde dehydrogenase
MAASMIIGGDRVASSGGAAEDVKNPATGEVVDSVPKGTAKDADQAVEAAQRAFPGWADTPFAKRAEILYQLEHLVHEREKDLAALLTKEQGKPLKESVLEMRRFAHTTLHYAGLGKAVRGGHVPLLDKGRYGMILKRPIGVCASIVPWNFPVSLMGNKIGPALLAGNTVVVKPASTAPLTVIEVIRLFLEAGLPPGVLNVVTGPGGTVGEALIKHPAVRKIGFTGATDTGRRVMAMAAEQIKRVTLELGGSDPMIVCDDADFDAAVSAAGVGRFFNCGQACLAVKRLYLFEQIYEPFVAKLVERTKKLKLGNGMNADTRLGPLHTDGQRKEVDEQVQDALKRGAKALAGAKRPDGGDFGKGNFYEPTLLVDVPDDARVATEEVFGPALPIFKVKSLDEAIEKANSSIYGLGSSVWTRDLARANHAAEKLEAGYTWINSAQIIFDELPFGGVKQSGLGKEHGSEALDYYMETKSVVVTPNPEKA